MFLTIRDFLNALGLEVNEAKTVITEYMVGQKRAKLRGVPPELTVQEKIIINGQTEFRDKHVTDKSTSRFLGLNLQNNLLWESHLRSGQKAILPACRKLLGMLSKLRNCLNEKNRLQLVNSLIISKISYGICIWGNTSSSTRNRTQVLLNQIGRFVTGLHPKTRTKEIMKNCKWLDIAQLTKYHSILQIFKTIHWGIPSHIDNLIQIDAQLKISNKTCKTFYY